MIQQPKIFPKAESENMVIGVTLDSQSPFISQSSKYLTNCHLEEELLKLFHFGFMKMVKKLKI